MAYNNQFNSHGNNSYYPDHYYYQQQSENQFGRYDHSTGRRLQPRAPRNNFGFRHDYYQGTDIWNRVHRPYRPVVIPRPYYPVPSPYSFPPYANPPYGHAYGHRKKRKCSKKDRRKGKCRDKRGRDHDGRGRQTWFGGLFQGFGW